jgi:hypothetical protein
MTPRLDRYGDELPEELLEEPRNHRCDSGWLDCDTDRLRPCPVCKPDLVERLRKQGRREW